MADYLRIDETMTEAPEEGLQTPTGQAHGAERRRNFGIAAVALGMFGVVGLIVGLTTNHSATPAPSSASSQSSETSQRPNFGRMIHPLLANVPVTAVPVPGDSSVEQYEASYHVVSGDVFTHLNYSVVVVKDRIHLDQENDVIGVACGNGTLTISLADGAALNFTARVNLGSTIITVLKEWGCTSSGVYVADSNGRVTVNGNTVTIPVVAAYLQSLFKEASLLFNGTGITKTEAATSSVASRVRRSVDDDQNDKSFLGDIEGDLSSAWSDVTGAISSAWDTAQSDFTSAVDDIEDFAADAQAVGSFVEELVGSGGDYDHTYTPVQKTASVGPKPLSSAIPELTGQYDYDFTISFQLEITNYELTKVSAVASGNAAATINAQGAVVSESFSGSSPTETILPKEQLVSFTIPVGPVPVPVSISASMSAKLDWTLTADVSIDANIKASGQIEAGITYEQGSFTPVKSSSFTGDAEMNYIAATATASGTLSLNTMLLVELMYSVGVQTQVGVSPMLSATVSETVEGGGIAVNGDLSGLTATPVDPSQPGYSSQCHPTESSSGTWSADTPSVLATVGCGVSITAAAIVDISALHVDKTYDICSGTCYQHLWNPIDSWCIHP
eukprot:m.331089 g.331089  ORF g.331089 m.331089 type:complete len:616 (+) comp20470_c0_seq1:117-1964(+)